MQLTTKHPEFGLFSFAFSMYYINFVRYTKNTNINKKKKKKVSENLLTATL